MVTQTLILTAGIPGKKWNGVWAFLCALGPKTPPSGNLCGCVSHTERLFQITVYSLR